MAKPGLTIGLVLDTSLDPPDGVQQYVIGVGEWLRSQGHDVHYLVGETRHRDLPNVHSLTRNISVVFNGNRTTIPLPARPKRLRAVLRKYDFDILHVQTPHSPFMAQPLIMRASSRTAVVGTFHIAAYSRLVTTGNWLLGWWLRPSLRRIDRMVSVSSAAAAFAKLTFHKDTQVLPNVFDYRLFHEAKPFERYNDDKLTILFFGRLVPRKGGRVLLEAFALLAKEKNMPPMRLVICGKGPDLPRLHKFANQHDLQDAVEFTGFVPEEDKPRFYASADITVFPSSGGESFGIVLLEAMASGRACVLAGDNPGYRSVIDARPELLFKPDDSQGLARILSKYIHDKAGREAAGDWGARHTKQFDKAVVGKKLLEIYEQALRERRGQ